MRLRLLGLALAACVLHCADLPRLDIGTCGNGVVEQDEDCDTFPTADPDASVDPKSKSLACGTSGASACRYVCTTSKQCPEGWGCSVSGVCRAPKGEFPKASEPLSAGIVTLVSGDFDADGRQDVLASGPRNVDGSARARVLYFGDGASLEHVTPLTAPIASPSVRDFDGDGIDDFVFGAGGLGAFDVMTGQSDRSFIPVMFPSARLPGFDVRPVQIHASKGTLPTGDTASFAYAGKVKSKVTGQTANALIAGDAGGLVISLPFGPEAINGPPVAAALFDADPTSTCDEVVIPTNTGQIYIFSPCRPGLNNRTAWASERAPVVLSGMDPSSTVFAGYVDSDKHLDLVYKAAGKNALVVAHGDGTGFPANRIVVGDLPGAEVPLAAGDLNNDGFSEFITPSGLLSSEVADGGTVATYVAVDIQRRARWTSARVGKLNGDAYPDFVAASADLPDIDFFTGGPNLQYTPSTIPTDGPVSFLSIGDFDGDTISDLVFVEGRAGSKTTDVSIAYGRPYGAPEAPGTLGRLADISFIDAFEATTPASLGLFLKEKTDTGEPQLAIAIMAGSGDRQPLAPLFLSDLQAKRPLVRTQGGAISRRWSPVSVHVGPFVDPDRTDIVAIATGYTFDELGSPVLPFPTGVWTSPGTKPAGSYGAAFELGEISARIDAVDTKTLASLVPTDTGDVDGDGIPDFVSVARTTGDPRPGVIVSHLKTSPPAFETVALGADVTVSASSVLRLLDVDADGFLDIVLVLADGNGGSKALVLFNDGKGGFGAPPVTIPIPPQAPDAKRADGGPVDIAIVTTGGADRSGKGKAQTKLAVVTERRLLFATLQPGRAGFDVKDAELAGLSQCTGVLAADLDGDGVQDVAIADSGSLRVFRQKEAHEK